jgi:hypothetical protein
VFVVAPLLPTEYCYNGNLETQRVVRSYVRGLRQHGLAIAGTRTRFVASYVLASALSCVAVQVKELGLYYANCSSLANELNKVRWRCRRYL